MKKKSIFLTMLLAIGMFAATLFFNPIVKAGDDLERVIIELRGIIKDAHLKNVDRSILKRLDQTATKLETISRGDPLPKEPENTTPYRDTTNAKFSDDFSQFNKGVWKTEGGELDIGNGEAKLHPNKTFHPTAMAGDTAWDDYTVYARVRLNDGDQAGVIFRAFNDNNYYEVLLNVKYNRLELWSFIENNRESMLEVKQDLYKNTWYNVRIEAKGNFVKVFINDVKRIDVRVGKLASGRVGISSYSKPASFDDIIVKPL